ncbi:hypothetical protein ACPUEN_05885 [Algoriphagus yeomjeoni]|uniref:hypothetical protein n=1 Tax=Algoriphagus yeomjeoni TaxID=291403 RepID=UPI003CE544E6
MNRMISRLVTVLVVSSLSVYCQRANRILDKIEAPVKVLNGSQNHRDSSGLEDLEEEISLRNEIPISKAVLKTWLPERVNNFERVQMLSGHRDQSGIISVLADYQIPDSSKVAVKVEILDGAGENGSLLIKASQERLNLDIEENKNGTVTRIYLRNGLRVRETENAAQNYSEIEFVDQSRFLFHLTGFGISIPQLWGFSDSASFSHQ